CKPLNTMLSPGKKHSFLPFRFFLSLIFLMAGSGTIFSQALSDTLREVEIINRKNNSRINDQRLRDFSPGMKITTIDSQTLASYKMQSVLRLLLQQVPVLVKSYVLIVLENLIMWVASASKYNVFL